MGKRAMNNDADQLILKVLAQAFAGLGVSVSQAGLELVANCVYKALSISSRNFHTAEHVLSLVDPARPIQTLAALFHDLVYYQVDLGFCAEAYEVFSPYVKQIPGELFQVRQEIGGERVFGLALTIFDIQPGQVLSPSAGLNEFVSALVMSQKLGAYLPEKELLKVMVYIEASIPFRGMDTDHSGPCATLAGRLKNACEQYDVALPADEQVETIQGAALFANKDVENFAVSDPVAFLNHTWKLLPETNTALRASGSYSIREYRQALQHMLGFLCGLDPATIFRHYRGVPAEAELRQMQRFASQNLEIGCQYLTVKLLSVALLEALAVATGGDAPAASFLGYLRGEDAQGLRLEDFLPQVTPSPEADPSAPVFQLLSSASVDHLYFELSKSPFSLFVYKMLGMAGVRQYLEMAQGMFSGRLSAEAFLSRVDKEIVSAIARACAALVLSRSEQLDRFIT